MLTCPAIKCLHAPATSGCQIGTTAGAFGDFSTGRVAQPRSVNQRDGWGMFRINVFRDTLTASLIWGRTPSRHPNIRRYRTPSQRSNGVQMCKTPSRHLFNVDLFETLSRHPSLLVCPCLRQPTDCDACLNLSSDAVTVSHVSIKMP